MSLINEALKKAQRQRSTDAAPNVAAAASTHAAAARRRSIAPLWPGLGALALAAGVAAIVMRSGPGKTTPAPAAARAAPVPDAPGASPAPDRSAPLAAPTPETAPLTVVFPALPPSSPSRASGSAEPTPVVARVSLAPPQAAPAPAAVPVARLAAAVNASEQEANVYAFLAGLRLSGVRGVDREARVLMNERVWRLNDIVSQELGLRISSVRPGLLVFTDAQGRNYEKPY